MFIVSNFKSASAENVLEVPSTQYPTIQSAVNAVKDARLSRLLLEHTTKTLFGATPLVLLKVKALIKKENKL